MGCIKSSPNVIIEFPNEKQGKNQPASYKNSKPNNGQVHVIQSDAIIKNSKGCGAGPLKDNISNHIEVEGDDESVSSRRHIKKNRGNPDKSYFERAVVSEEKQKKQSYGVVEDNHLINEEDENALKKQVQMSQIEQQQLKQQAIPPPPVADEKRNNAQSPITETDEAQKELTSANEELKGKEDLEENEEDQQTFKKTETNNNTEKTDTGDNYQCNALRAQPTIASQFSLNQPTNGSVSMQTSGLRLSNSSIITSGFDYEKKRRDLIRKISDEIDEIDEFDENNFQIGGQVCQQKQKQSNNAEPKGISGMLRTEDKLNEGNNGQVNASNPIQVDDDNDF